MPVLESRWRRRDGGILERHGQDRVQSGFYLRGLKLPKHPFRRARIARPEQQEDIARGNLFRKLRFECVIGFQIKTILKDVQCRRPTRERRETARNGFSVLGRIGSKHGRRRAHVEPGCLSLAGASGDRHAQRDERDLHRPEKHVEAQL